jgi:hypothetical protein
MGKQRLRRGSGGAVALTAEKRGTWPRDGATIPFVRRSCGYVGTSDGWTDLSDNFRLDWEFDVAEDGNIALVGELDLERGHEFTLGIGFGDSLHSATTRVVQSLGSPFTEHRARLSSVGGARRAMSCRSARRAATAVCSTPRATACCSRTRTRRTRER